MHVTPTGNARITYKDLAEKPERFTPLNTQNGFMYLYISMYTLFLYAVSVSGHKAYKFRHERKYNLQCQNLYERKRVGVCENRSKI
jgi:hypothetical protein